VFELRIDSINGSMTPSVRAAVSIHRAALADPVPVALPRPSVSWLSGSLLSPDSTVPSHSHWVNSSEHWWVSFRERQRLRESALIRALKELAAQCGVELVVPLQIDSVGEISIVAKPEPGQSTHRLGSFGQAFVDHLNEFSPRTNLKAGTKLLPSNGRCHMSHVDVQRMVMVHFKTLSLTRL
jgi:hypothetical protein